MNRWFIGYALAVLLAGTLSGFSTASAGAQSYPSPSPSPTASSSMHP